jgi:chromosomal replication initiator protein
MTAAAGPPPRITPADIMAAVADYAALPVEDLTGNLRTRVVMIARQEAMYLCAELTDLSAAQISTAFGRRDYTVVLHAQRKVESNLSERSDVRDRIMILRARIKLRTS